MIGLHSRLTRTISLVVCLIYWLAVAHVTAQRVCQIDLFPIWSEGKVGYMDRFGEIRIPPKFSYGDYFTGGRAIASLPEDKGKLGIIDESGESVSKSRFDVVKRFSEGLAPAGFGSYGPGWAGNLKWGFVDKNGVFRIEPQFKDTLGFSEGLAAVENQDRKWGFIDKSGKVVIPFRYEYVVSFSQGLACVLVDGYFGFINKSGKMVITPRYSTPSRFREGLAHVAIGKTKETPYLGRRLFWDQAGQQHVFINKAGRIVFRLPRGSIGAYDFSEGLAQLIIADGRIVFADGKGKYVIGPLDYDYAGNFSAGLAPVIIDEKVAFINKIGKIVFRTEYSYADDFRNGLALTRKGKTVDDGGDGKNIEYFYIDTKGRVIWQSGK